LCGDDSKKWEEATAAASVASWCRPCLAGCGRSLLAAAGCGDATAAARDLQQVLRLEPRHWQALQQLAQWQEEAGDDAGALRSIEAALAIHPRLRGGEARLRDLRRKALGDDA
jgi:predicted TPR repeat methyltransferase